MRTPSPPLSCYFQFNFLSNEVQATQADRILSFSLSHCNLPWIQNILQCSTRNIFKHVSRNMQQYLDGFSTGKMWTFDAQGIFKDWIILQFFSIFNPEHMEAKHNSHFHGQIFQKINSKNMTRSISFRFIEMRPKIAGGHEWHESSHYITCFWKTGFFEAGWNDSSLKAWLLYSNVPRNTFKVRFFGKKRGEFFFPQIASGFRGSYFKYRGRCWCNDVSCGLVLEKHAASLLNCMIFVCFPLPHIEWCINIDTPED